VGIALISRSAVLPWHLLEHAHRRSAARSCTPGTSKCRSCSLLRLILELQCPDCSTVHRDSGPHCRPAAVLGLLACINPPFRPRASAGAARICAEFRHYFVSIRYLTAIGTVALKRRRKLSAPLARRSWFRFGCTARYFLAPIPPCERTAGRPMRRRVGGKRFGLLSFAREVMRYLVGVRVHGAGAPRR
jgi:hypothetical protein